MQARMNNPALILPESLKALYALDKSTADLLPSTTRKLVHLRASQINACSVCVGMHATELKHEGESDDRIFSVAAWRDTPYFTDAERAALALTEELTRIADKGDPVSDAVWAEASKHYGEKELAALILSIAQINVWNRLNAAVRMKAGTPWKRSFSGDISVFCLADRWRPCHWSAHHLQGTTSWQRETISSSASTCRISAKPRPS